MAQEILEAWLLQNRKNKTACIYNLFKQIVKSVWNVLFIIFALCFTDIMFQRTFEKTLSLSMNRMSDSGKNKKEQRVTMQ